jgi:hypothetical protein
MSKREQGHIKTRPEACSAIKPASKINSQPCSIHEARDEEVSPLVHEALRTPGQPLDAVTRNFMEPRFGHDFSKVRVHTDTKAAESARAVNALAHTVGHHVVFGAGQYRPGILSGHKLIAHELTHVVQQASGGQSGHGAHSFTLQRQAAPVVRRPPFDDQPAEFRSVLEDSFSAGRFGCRDGTDAASCFNRLDAGARSVLTSLYNRLSRFGLWDDHVLYVRGIWTSGVGGAHLTVVDHIKFLSALLNSARFCVDTAAGGMLHRGTTSVREISTSDSLHITLGARNTFSAHIDAISPAAGRDPGGLCRYEPTRAAAHIGREAIPGVLADKLRIELLRGLQIFPEPRPTFGLPEREAPQPEFIRFEIRF